MNHFHQNQTSGRFVSCAGTIQINGLAAGFINSPPRYSSPGYGGGGGVPGVALNGFGGLKRELAQAIGHVPLEMAWNHHPYPQPYQYPAQSQSVGMEKPVPPQPLKPPPPPLPPPPPQMNVLPPTHMEIISIHYSSMALLNFQKAGLEKIRHIFTLTVQIFQRFFDEYENIENTFKEAYKQHERLKQVARESECEVNRLGEKVRELEVEVKEREVAYQKLWNEQQLLLANGQREASRKMEHILQIEELNRTQSIKVETLSQNLTAAHEKLNKVEAVKIEMEKDMQDIEDFRNLYRSARDSRIELDDKIEELLGELEERKQFYEEREEEQKQFYKDREDEKKKLYEDREEQLRAEFEEKLQKMEEELEIQKGQMESERKSSQAKAQEFDAYKMQMEMDNENIQNDLATRELLLEYKNGEFNKQSEEQNQLLENKQKEFESLKEMLQLENNQMKAELQASHAELKESKEIIENMRVEKEALEKTQHTKVIQCDRLCTQRDQVSTTLGKHEKTIKKLKKKVKNLRCGNSSLEAQLEKAKKENRALNLKLQKYETDSQLKSKEKAKPEEPDKKKMMMVMSNFKIPRIKTEKKEEERASAATGSDTKSDKSYFNHKKEGNLGGVRPVNKEYDPEKQIRAKPSTSTTVPSRKEKRRGNHKRKTNGKHNERELHQPQEIMDDEKPKPKQPKTIIDDDEDLLSV